MAVHTPGMSRRLRVIIGTAVVLLLAAIAVPVVRALSTRADRPVAGTSVSPSGSAVGVSPSGSAKPAYTATFTGDADGSHWTGTESVTFSNPGPAAMAQVWLRTWGNGPHGCGQVAVRVTAVEGGAVGDPTVGCTALPITLAPALGARKQATISFAVSIAVPPDRSRFGVAGGDANLGNALPLLAVPGDQGRPLPPYTGLGESFYSVTSDFTVTLTHPTALAVP